MIVILVEQVKGSVDWIILFYYGIYLIFTDEGKLAFLMLSTINYKHLLQSLRTVDLYQLQMHSSFF